MIGGLSLLYKQFQDAGPLSRQAARGQNRANIMVLLRNAMPALELIT
jgi:hypothetical protein